RPNGLRTAEGFGRPEKVEITEAASNEALDSEEQNNIAVYRKNIPAVVNITSRAVTFDFFYGLVPQEGQGSGFVIDKEGHILTNYHVIADAQRVEVTMHNRKKYRAKVVGTDRSHDLAIVQIDAPNLTSAVLGDSRNLEVGQKVYAIGNPFGLSGTLTTGIVSSIRSVREPDGMTIDEAIQTDAAINPDCNPDGCGDQSGQLWRPSDELARGGNWDQYHDRVECGPKRRHRLCDSHQHGQSRAERPGHAGAGAPSGAGCAHDPH